MRGNREAMNKRKLRLERENKFMNLCLSKGIDQASFMTTNFINLFEGSENLKEALLLCGYNKGHCTKIINTLVNKSRFKEIYEYYSQRFNYNQE